MKNIDCSNVRNWKLKKIRIEEGITQEVMAEYLNMKRTAYQYIESKGKLTDDVLVKLSRFFDRPYKDFLPDDEIPVEHISGGRLNQPDTAITVSHRILSKEEKHLLTTYDKLTEKNKKSVLHYLDLIAQSQEKE